MPGEKPKTCFNRHTESIHDNYHTLKDKAKGVHRFAKSALPVALERSKKTAAFGFKRAGTAALYNFQIVSTTGPLSVAICTHDATWQWFCAIARMTLCNLAPLAILSACYSTLNDQLYENQDFNTSTIAGTSMMALSWSLMTALSALTMLYKLHTQTKLFVRTTVLNAQHHSTLHSPKVLKDRLTSAHKHAICEAAQCTGLRYAKGEMRALIAWVFMSGMLALLSSSSLLGPVLPVAAWFTQCILNGETMLELRLADKGMCDRHRMLVFQENPELAFSLGFMHQAACWVAGLLLNTLLAVPTNPMNPAISSTIESMLPKSMANSANFWLSTSSVNTELQLIFSCIFLGLTYYLSDVNENVEKSSRWPTPTSIMRRWIVGLTMDVSTQGVKDKAKKMASSSSGEPAMRNELADKAQIFYSKHQMGIHGFWNTITPQLLHSFGDLAKDEVCGPYIILIATKLLDSIAEIRKATSSTGVKLAQALPKGVVAYAASTFANVPKVLVKTLLTCLDSPLFHNVLDYLEHELRKLMPQDKRLAMPDHVTMPEKFFTVADNNEDDGDDEFELITQETVHAATTSVASKLTYRGRLR